MGGGEMGVGRWGGGVDGSGEMGVPRWESLDGSGQMRVGRWGWGGGRWEWAISSLPSPHCIGVFSPLSILGIIIFAILISLSLFLKNQRSKLFNNYIFKLNQNSYPFYSNT